MSISYEGIGHLSVTFPNNNAVENQVCTLNSNGKVSTCAAGGVFLGVAESVNDTYAGVQIGGFVKVGYTGTAPAMGYTKLSADGAGGIRADANGNAYWVAQVDTVNNIATIKL